MRSSAGAWWQEKQDKVVNKSCCNLAGHNRSLYARFWLVYSTKPTLIPDDLGGQVMSGIGVQAAPCLLGLRQFGTKPSGSLVEPQRQDRRIGGQRWDPGVSRDFEVEGTRRDRKSCVDVKWCAVAGHLPDAATTSIPKVPFAGVC
jgi:hypothetical protein